MNKLLKAIHRYNILLMRKAKKRGKFRSLLPSLYSPHYPRTAQRPQCRILLENNMAETEADARPARNYRKKVKESRGDFDYVLEIFKAKASRYKA